jgi:hypothetical protein
MAVATENKWAKPQKVDGLDMAFGGNMKNLLPPMLDLPEEFTSRENKWHDIVSHWFFRGLPSTTKYTPKDGIDPNEALRHVGTIMGSFEPKHEHKTAACAWLLSLWFEDIVLPKEGKSK